MYPPYTPTKDDTDELRGYKRLGSGPADLWPAAFGGLLHLIVAIELA